MEGVKTNVRYMATTTPEGKPEAVLDLGEVAYMAVAAESSSSLMVIFKGSHTPLVIRYANARQVQQALDLYLAFALA